MHSCISMCAAAPAVFVFLLQQSDMLIWKGGKQEVLIQEARCGHVKLNVCLPDASGYLCMR